MATENQTTKTEQDPDRMAIAEGLIADLVGVFQGEQKAANKAEKAKEEAEAAKEGSIKTLADRLSSLHNVPLDEEMIDMIALSAAEKIAGKNANVLKARKSEIKLLIRNREHVKSTVEAYEKFRDKMKEKDDKFSLNLRAKTLGALRKLQKDPDLTPVEVIRKEYAEAKKETSEEEKAKKLLDKLLDSPALHAETSQGRKVMDPRAVRALEMLQEVLEDGPQAREEKKAKEEEPEDDIEAALSLVPPSDILDEDLDADPDNSDLGADEGGDALHASSEIGEDDDELAVGGEEEGAERAEDNDTDRAEPQGKRAAAAEKAKPEPKAVKLAADTEADLDFDLDALVNIS